MSPLEDLHRKRAEYLEKEHSARTKATYSADPEDRSYWQQLAVSWHNLADHIDRAISQVHQP